MTLQSLRFRLIFIFAILAISMVLPGKGQSQTLGLPERGILQPYADTNYIKELINAGVSLLDNHTDSALQLLKKARYLSSIHAYNNGIALSLLKMTAAYSIKNNIPQARESLDEAKTYCLLSENKDQMLLLWYQAQFIMYKYAGQSDSALITLRKAGMMLEQVKDTALIINTYNHIAAILIDHQDYTSAYPYIKKALELNQGQNIEMIVSYINLAYIYGYQDHIDSMYHYAEQAFNFSRKFNFPRYERSASILLHKYFLMKGNRVKAAEHEANALRLLDQKVTDNHLYVYRTLSKTFARNGFYNKALEYGNKALEVINATQKQRKEAISLYAQLAVLYRKMGNADKAYDYAVAYMNAADSISIKEINIATNRVERQLRLTEKEKEIVVKENMLLQQKAQLRNRNIWIAVIGGGLIIGLSLSALLYSLYRNSRKKIHILHQQKEIDELKAMIDGEEKERNRIAIELHDNIGGMLSAASYTLTSIKEVNSSPEQQSAFNKINNIVTEVRNEVRKTAHILMPDVLLRNSLSEALQQYCNFIERDTGIQINVQHRGNFNNLHKDVQLSLYRISQELIQNVLKHAKASQVMVQLHSGMGLISLTVEDNGIGFNQEFPTEGRGLQNIRSRLMIIDGKISIDSEAGKGCSIYVEVNTVDNGKLKMES